MLEFKLKLLSDSKPRPVALSTVLNLKCSRIFKLKLNLLCYVSRSLFKPKILENKLYSAIKTFLITYQEVNCIVVKSSAHSKLNQISEPSDRSNWKVFAVVLSVQQNSEEVLSA